MTRVCTALLLTAGGLLAGCPSATDEVRAISPSEDGGVIDDAGTGTARASVVTTTTIPIPEASALARRGDRFYAVGDHTAEVVTFGIAADGTFVDVVAHDLTKQTTVGSHGSQWEGVAVDDEGKVVVLSEDGEVIVFDAKLEKRVGGAPIDVAAVRKTIGGADDNNSQGEGIVLLGHGHVLVANEKLPPALVELGPAGEAPLGFTRGAAVGAFEAPSKLVPLAWWPFADLAALPDVSDLALAPDGSLWALTQEGRRLVRLEDRIAPGTPAVKGVQRVELPAELKTAEGLAFAGRDLVIATDLKLGLPNLFRLGVSP